MSRTTRRGKPSRSFHMYIGLGIIKPEKHRWWHWRALAEHQGHLYWKNGADDPTTYEQYAALKIRRYHMDFRPRDKCPGMYHREDTLKQKRLHKIEMYHASRSEDYDVVLSPRVNEAKRDWDWY